MKITLATKITIARIFLIIPTIIVFIIAQCFRDNYTVYLASLIVSAVLFSVCCSTDFLDGHIARKPERFRIWESCWTLLRIRL